jgi:hypothetical protein
MARTFVLLKYIEINLFVIVFQTMFFDPPEGQKVCLLFSIKSVLTRGTYLSQNSPPLRQGATDFNLDFLEDAANDPNFNPFATKSKVVNDLQQVLSFPICYM